MIIVTGGAGFIGSVLVWELNKAGYRDIWIVDALGCGTKWHNLVKRNYDEFCHHGDFLGKFSKIASHVKAVFHMGACSSTTEKDADFLMRNNVQYSQELFRVCSERNIPFLYASSAATYGQGEVGFSDTLEDNLRPINPYGYSKYCFDRWVLKQKHKPRCWAGLKFFNVYGPNEYHKGGQASVVFHAFNQLRKQGHCNLFKSHRPEYQHGEQLRDFIYVKDVTRAMVSLFESMKAVGIVNIGTGQARTFADLGRNVCRSMELKEDLRWIDMPEGLRAQYQYYTQATVEKLSNALGRWQPTSLEDGIRDYVSQYLAKEDPYL